MADERTVVAAEIFKRVIERPAEQRSTFLDEACGRDVGLRREVESLLNFHRDGDQFLEEPAIAVAVKSFLNAALRPDQRIGNYLVVSHIGSGGMGEVYLAHDEKLNRQVALKLVRFGLGTEGTMRHFGREAQILASLNHPNIAQLYGADITPNGFSFLVIEYVEGVRIDNYCDDNHLSISERLGMFRRVCAGVHYAHQRLIIHRDIKPANILITKEGEPKLLDFGIAKLLNPEAPTAGEQTMTFAAAMTPEYASPEQVRGETMTTASDIYSLGVILYELLTGQRPYRTKDCNPAEIARAITEQAPVRPSAAIAKGDGNLQPQISNLKSLKGDVDNIVLKAMRKEPQRRYASVEHFSEDIRRHLEGLPVTARKDTLAYRSGKFIRRHKAGVAAMITLMLSLVGGIIATTWQAQMAQAQRIRAENRSAALHKLANEFLFEFHDAIAKYPGSTPARKRLVELALQTLDNLAGEAGQDAALKQDLAAAYLKVGDVQGRPGFPNLGDTAGALASYRKSLHIRETLPPALTDSVDAQRELATNYDRIGDTLRLSGDAANALVSYRSGLNVRQRLIKNSPANTEIQGDLAKSYERIGDTLAQMGQRQEALEQERQALALNHQVFTAAPGNADAKRSLFIGFVKMGDRLRGISSEQEALRSYRDAVTLAKELADADPENARAQRELSVGYEKIGNSLAALKQSDEAIAQYRESLLVRERLAKADEKNAEAQRDLSSAYGKVADILASGGKLDEALANYRKALAIDQRLSLLNPANMQARQDVADSYAKIGDLLTQQGAFADALSVHVDAMKLRKEVSEKDRENTEALRDLAMSYAKLGDVSVRLASQTSAAESRRHFDEAKHWYENAVTALNAIQARTAPTKSDAEELDRIRKEITSLSR
jgi:eukaryotic-like serine/threonine-protein kinase